MSIAERYFRRVVFKNFLKIELNANEIAVAEDSLKNKYSKGTVESLVYGLICLPTLLFVDTSILTSVLIPITMVSGTAWFAVSLINIKKKFEDFGNELTIDLYRSFITSLVLLSLMTIIALNSSIFFPITEWGGQYQFIAIISGLLGTWIVLKMIYDIFSGATKYDMNDSMLTGQNEAAEKYFKKSLSLLNSCAEHIKHSTTIDEVGYFISLAFFEIFNFILLVKGHNDQCVGLIENAKMLKTKPATSKMEMVKQFSGFVESFLAFTSNLQDAKTKKSFQNIQLELNSVHKYASASQQLTNLRIATVLEEIEDMLVGQGEALFTKRMEIEKKYKVKTLPKDLNRFENDEIVQGYLSITSNSEQRVRKQGNVFTLTTKEPLASGYRMEREEYISVKTFDELWPKTERKRISKTRYKIPYQDHIIELDKFQGGNEGLILAEVEFKSEEEAKNFRVPEWFGEDVTIDPKYKNANLAK